MTVQGLSSITIALACAATSLAVAAGQPTGITPTQAATNFQAINQNAGLARHTDGRIGRVYGRAFSSGRTAAESTQRFLDGHLSMWGVSPADLIAEGPFDDGHHTQPIGFIQDTGTYKFTGTYYKQTMQGVEVFRSKLVLLTRNEANNPLVLASADLHDVRNAQIDPQLMRKAIDQDLIIENAKASFKTPAVFMTDSQRVIFAGVDNVPHKPTLAQVSYITVNNFEKHLIVTDAATGEILFQENRIHTLDISGNVSAMATEGIATDQCEDEVITPMPYLYVNGGGQTALTDADGNYTLSNPGVTPVDIDATMAGKWFTLTDGSSTPEAIESASVTPPGPGDLLFNASNNNANVRAQMNAYIEANRVRDFAFSANPSYPTINNEGFEVFVNLTGGFCPGNAWYDPDLVTINFCLSSGGSPNTAWSSVIHHEYGHHLVNAGGSGQGQYGEGMGDVMSTIILDDPRLGQGFFGSCNSSLRNADNNHQFPCSGGIHDCGQLISGCVWDTRQALVSTEPDNYTDILNFLAVNSILVHSGSTISPQITIDWLTLDDDDGDIGNGTPHYGEIAAGFGAHSMDAPPLNLIAISYPDNQPEFVNPNGGTTMVVQFDPLSGTLDPSSPMLMVDTGAGFVASPMTQLSGNQFQATFPSADCSSELAYYITSETTAGATQNSPANAPSDGTFSATAAFDAPVAIFEDNFQTNMGWAVSGNASDGQWNRGVPVNCNRGDPGSDFDGSGQAYLTDNSSASQCNSDVDGGTTTLTSPVMEATDSSVINYTRWYDNTAGSTPMTDTMVVEVSDDAGSSWVNLETVGPGGSEVSGGWITKQFSLNDIPGFIPSNQFQIRFSASDLGDGSVVEAGVDAVKLLSFDCNPCVADLNGDGDLNFFDVSAFLTAFNSGDLSADFTGDGVLNFFDVSDFLSAFSAGCP